MSTSRPKECPWEIGQLGNSMEHAIPAPDSLELEVSDALGMQPISIRLPRSLIRDLKLIADKEGLGYQPLMRRVLVRFVEAEFRSMAHEQLISDTRKLGDRAIPDAEEEVEPSRCAIG